MTNATTMTEISPPGGTRSPAVRQNTSTPTKNPNECRTSGSSRKRFSRGVKVEVPHWTTRSSNENTSPVNVNIDAPTANSIAAARSSWR